MTEARRRLPDVLHIVRVTLETKSPLSTGGDEAGSLYDAPILRDANGLPTIAGSSIAGVLRHLVAEIHDEPKAEQIFGYQRNTADDGLAARLRVSFAAVHDSKGMARNGLIWRPNEIEDDEVLRTLALAAPLKRDHVALNLRGVADDRKKFDRAAVPRGTRFSFEMTMWGFSSETKDDEGTLAQLVGIMRAHPGFSLGGAIRRGYGRVKVVAANYLACGVIDPLALRQVRAEPLHRLRGSAKIGVNALDLSAAAKRMDVDLEPIGAWRIGGGVTAFRFNPEQDEKPADTLVLAEPWIEWNKDGTGQVRVPDATANKVVLTIPASAIKGALAHRTLFHFNRLRGADGMIDMEALSKGAGSDTLKALYKPNPDGSTGQREVHDALDSLFGREGRLDSLFGRAKERQQKTTRGEAPLSSEQAGRLVIDDAIVEVDRSQIQKIDHNSIDRFTGGVRKGLLFSEEVVTGGKISIKIAILPKRKTMAGQTIKLDAKLMKAFEAALQDLCNGRLALGAKRLGYCRGARNQPERIAVPETT